MLNTVLIPYIYTIAQLKLSNSNKFVLFKFDHLDQDGVAIILEALILLDNFMLS